MFSNFYRKNETINISQPKSFQIMRNEYIRTTKHYKVYEILILIYNVMIVVTVVENTNFKWDLIEFLNRDII